MELKKQENRHRQTWELRKKAMSLRYLSPFCTVSFESNADLILAWKKVYDYLTPPAELRRSTERIRVADCKRGKWYWAPGAGYWALADSICTVRDVGFVLFLHRYEGTPNSFFLQFNREVYPDDLEIESAYDVYLDGGVWRWKSNKQKGDSVCLPPGCLAALQKADVTLG